MSEQPLDVATVTRDALLLDALGRGEAPLPGDDLAEMLAAWRADLAEPTPTEQPAPTGPVPPLPVREPRRRREVRLRVAIAAAAAVVGLAGGVTIAASGAGPDSPLWPITRLVYEDRADSRIAEEDARRAIADARDSLDSQRYGDVERYLDEATVLIGRIRDLDVASRLRDEVASLRALLPNSVPTPPPSPSAPAGGPSAPPGPGAGQSGGPGGGAGPTPTGGGLLPGLPLPSLPLPLPPLPTLPPLPPLLGE